MRDVAIIGVGMTPFGKFLDKSLNELAYMAVWNAIKDAAVPPRDIGAAYVGNCLAGSIMGQAGIRGQVMLNYCGFSGLPIANCENACATGGTALMGAWMDVALGLHDVALALGAEKMYLADTPKSIKALAGLSDVDLANTGFQFTVPFAFKLRRYMKEFGATKEHFAKVVVKNSYNGSLNPYAQHRKPLTMEEVLNSRLVSDPLHLYMCSSMGDGAAATIICAADVARKYTSKPIVQIGSIALRSGAIRPRGADNVPNIRALTVAEAYRRAGVGPEDVDVAEVHDAMAPAEITRYEELGFCKAGEGFVMLEQGRTAITGDIAVNPSGGLCARGHPVAATGLAQVAEITWQLRGEAGQRQVANPKVGLCEDSGGWLGEDNAACCIIVLKR